MRISRTSYSTLAAGFGPWVPVDYLQATFNVALAVLPSAAATGQLFSVQYTMDDQSIFRQVNWTQATTTVTVTDGIQAFGPANSTTYNPHGLTTGDTVQFLGSGP